MYVWDARSGWRRRRIEKRGEQKRIPEKTGTNGEFFEQIIVYLIRFWDASRNGKSERPRLIQKMQAGSCERQSQTGPEKQLHEINPAGHHPPPIPPPELPGFRHDLPAGPAQLRRTGSADSGTAADPRQREHAHEPLARTAVPSGRIRIGPGVRPDRMRMYRRTDRIQKPAEPLPAALRTAVYLRPLPVYVAAALYRISRPGAGIHQKHQFGTALAERQFRLSGVRYGDPRTARVDHEREHAARTAVHGAAVLQPHSRGTGPAGIHSDRLVLLQRRAQTAPPLRRTGERSPAREGPHGRRNLPGICRPGDQRCLSFDAAPLRPGDGQDRYDSVQKYDRQCLAFDLHGGRTGDRHGAVRGGQPRYAGRRSPGPLRRIRRRRVAADAFGAQHDVRLVGTQIQPLHHRYPAGHRPERRKAGTVRRTASAALRT